MDTSNSPDLNFTLEEMFRSEHEEDHLVANNALAAIDNLLHVLRPVLKYIVVPVCIGNLGVSEAWDRLVIVIPEKSNHFLYALALNAEGKVVFLRNTEGEKFDVVDYVHDPAISWSRHRVSDIFAGLQRVLAEAKRKREQHLAAISRRLELLDGIQVLIAQARIDQ